MDLRNRKWNQIEAAQTTFLLLKVAQSTSRRHFFSRFSNLSDAELMQ
jgi:hypothetical protein